MTRIFSILALLVAVTIASADDKKAAAPKEKVKFDGVTMLLAPKLKPIFRR